MFVGGKGKKRGAKGDGWRTARFTVQYLNYIRTRKTCNTS